MNKTPRRQVRVLPPLRGRLAATASPELKRRFSEPLDRKLPEVSKSRPQLQRDLPKPDPVKDKNGKILIVWILLVLLLLTIASMFN